MTGKHLFVLTSALGALTACSSGDPPPNDQSQFGPIAASVAHPTGTLESTNARAVAEEFGKIDGLGTSGYRFQAASSASSTTVSCPSGGSYGIDSSAGSSSGHAVVSYNGCCYIESCCIDGQGDWYYATGGGSTFTLCGTYDLYANCLGEPVEAKYSGCLSSSGWAYSVEVDGKTFTVTGSYGNGSGTLEITASNGSWTCTYTPTQGTCTGTSTLTF